MKMIVIYDMKIYFQMFFEIKSKHSIVYVTYHMDTLLRILQSQPLKSYHHLSRQVPGLYALNHPTHTNEK